MKNFELKGYILATTAAVMWGVSGTFAQFLFQQRGFSPEGLVTIRLLVSGFLLLAIAAFQSKKPVFNIWRTRQDAISLVVFGILGMLGVQYTYFAAIAHSNSATATVIQYLGPAMIAVWYAVSKKRLPTPYEMLAIVLALSGTFLLVTHGKIGALAISVPGLLWGLASAVGLAIHTVQPARLLQKYDASIVAAWGLVVGGVLFGLFYHPWEVEGTWDLYGFAAVSFVIVGGSLMAFHFYLSAVKLIGGTRASLLACAEPLAAAYLAVIWLNVPFGLYDWIGTVFILGTITLLTVPPLRKPKSLKA